eukprot:1075242-Pyramimonas_sp.AAC.1
MRENGSTGRWPALGLHALKLTPQGFNVPNFQILTVMLFRAPGVSTSRAQRLLRPLNHYMRRTQQQFDSLLERIRACAHTAERTRGYIGG